jgi:TatD DNase family protein
VTFPIIDTHAHLDDQQFENDLPQVLKRAQDVGITGIVCVATSAASSARCIELAQADSSLVASVGIHPNQAATAGPEDWNRVLDLSQTAGVVALGETGLDRHWHDTPMATQEDFFNRHLEAGRRLNLPLIIHCREATADVLRMLREHFDRNGPIHGVMHSYTGDQSSACACLEMGLHISFAGMLTYKSAESLRKVAATIPIDRVLVETDSPYLSPVPVRGRRNEPAHVLHTLNCLADCLNMKYSDLAEKVVNNARDLFGQQLR